MVDFHSHILPGIDDGAKDIETSVKMLELSKSQGVHTIIATPHYYANKATIDEFLKAREDSYNSLMAYVTDKEIEIPKILLGVEVAFSAECTAIDMSRLCIENTNAILIELPYTFLNGWIYKEIYNISMKHSLDVILAHAERYIGKRNDFSMIDPFLDLDMYIQINADSFIDRRFRKAVKKFFEKGKVDLIGSDAHNLTTRVSRIDKAYRLINKSYGEKELKRIRENSIKILGEQVV